MTHQPFKPLTLALGLLLGSPLTVLAADSAGPVFYGTVNLSLDHERLEGARSNAEAGRQQWSLNSNNSRLGVTQAIALQNGLTAVLKAEVRINADDGKESDGNTFSQRDIYAGLKGEFGQVIAGRFNTPLRATEGKLDLFNHLRGDIDAVLGGQNRVSNIVQYSSPEYAGTRLHVALVPGENSDTDGDGKNDTRLADAYSAAAVYDDRRYYAALAYDHQQAAGTTTDGLTRSNRWQLAAGWNAGNTRLGAILQYARDAHDRQREEHAWVLNASYRLQALTLKAQGGQNRGERSDQTRTLAAVGADYALDPSSTLYITYATLNLDRPQAADRDDRVLSLGFNQRF